MQPAIDRHRLMDPRQEWETPPDFWRVIDDEFSFDIDVCASVQNAQCPIFYSHTDNALRPECAWFFDDATRYTQPVTTAYCNPGFANIGPWVTKAVQETRKHPGSIAVMMALCAPSTAWWAKAVRYATEIRLLSPRVQFVPAPGVKKSSNSKENALLVFRGEHSNNLARIRTWRWKK